MLIEILQDSYVCMFDIHNDTCFMVIWFNMSRVDSVSLLQTDPCSMFMNPNGL